MTVSIAVLVTVLGRKGFTSGPPFDSSFWKNIACYLSVNFWGGKKYKQIVSGLRSFFPESKLSI